MSRNSVAFSKSYVKHTYPTYIGELESIYLKDDKWYIRCSNLECGTFPSVPVAVEWYHKVSTFQKELNE